MCGLVGIAFNDGRGPQPEAVTELMQLLGHRGPDDEGVYSDSFVTLGHKRLAIIDLSGGRQPMISSDGRFVLVYNGEIYNYRQLRRVLEGKGYRFTTQSDTEVLLYWLIEHGQSGLSGLNGMFAFALWDRNEKKVFMGRDRLEIKPLYYHEDPGGNLVFASEIKAILPRMASRTANLEAVYEFITFQNIFSEKTFFLGINRLMPGHWLQWRPGSLTTGCYWDVVFPRDYQGSFGEAVQTYSETLDRAVARHLISDVPVGTYLSGGFDSSSVASVAAHHLSGPVHTFTGAFTDASYYDERAGSRAVAQHIGAIAHEIEITPEDYLAYYGNVVYLLDEPTLGTGALPTYMTSMLASRHVKVVLTGHGGDEMYAGYQVNKVALFREACARGISNGLSALLGVRMDEMTRFLYYWLYPILFPEVRHGLFIMVPRRKRPNFFASDFLSQMRHYEPLDRLEDFANHHDDLPGESLARLYLKVYLPTLLNQEDRMSMGHSIESRTPLCDNELLELALRIPLDLKLMNRSLKAIIKEAMKPYLPEILYRLDKRGFPTPFSLWYRREPLKSFAEDILLDKRTRQRGIFNVRYLEEVFNRNLTSKSDTLYDYTRANIIWSVEIVEAWFRTFIDPVRPAPIC